MSKSYIGRVFRDMIGLAVVSMLALPVRAETLADALAAAYINSGLIQQNRALLRAADEDVVVAAAKLRPILQWSSTVSRSLSSGQAGANGTYRSADSLRPSCYFMILACQSWLFRFRKRQFLAPDKSCYRWNKQF